MGPPPLPGQLCSLLPLGLPDGGPVWPGERSSSRLFPYGERSQERLPWEFTHFLKTPRKRAWGGQGVGRHLSPPEPHGQQAAGAHSGPREGRPAALPAPTHFPGKPHSFTWLSRLALSTMFRVGSQFSEPMNSKKQHWGERTSYVWDNQ